jgi:hypothetical protein
MDLGLIYLSLTEVLRETLLHEITHCCVLLSAVLNDVSGHFGVAE